MKGGRDMKRWGIVTLAVFLMLYLLGLGRQVQGAEEYPVKPIVFIMGVEAGSDGDVLSRPFAHRVSTLLGQPIVVVNKPGAGSSLAYREVQSAKPDGYTIGWASATIIINKLQGVSPYDYHDFTMLGTYYTAIPIIVASTKTKRPFKTIEEVISFAKAHPGDVSIATSGVGMSWWVATMAFQEGAGAQFNIIPQLGAGAFAIAQVAGGHTDLAVLGLAAAKPHIDAGNVRFLAVFGSKRVSGYDHVPCFTDVGYDISWESPNLTMGPPKMPKHVTDVLVKAVEKAANEPEYKKYLMERYAIPNYLPPDKALSFLDGQRIVVRRIMEKAGILKEK